MEETISQSITLHKTGTRNEREVRFLGHRVGLIVLLLNTKTGIPHFVGVGTVNKEELACYDWLPLAQRFAWDKILLN